VSKKSIINYGVMVKIIDYLKNSNDPKAQNLLNEYDSARTGRDLELVRVINEIIASGDIRLARQINGWY